MAIEDGSLRWPAAAIPRVAALLAHASRTVRRRAAGALASAVGAGDIDAESAEALLDDADPATRWGAAFALHRAGKPGPRVIDVALETFGNDSGDLRWAASTVLAAAAAREPRLLTRLRALAREGSPSTRKMALLCLADCGERDASFFASALDDADTHVRLAAVTVLGRLGQAGQGGQDGKDGDADDVRSALARVAASDSAATVQRAAAAVLLRLGRARP